jgi:hypothetical protein
MKGYYASEFFYISSISFSKLSLLVLFHTIVAVHRLHRRLMLGFGSFIILWSMASLVAVAFQCELPQPWEMTTSRCFNMVSMSLEIIASTLTFLASLLDCILYHRCIDRAIHHYAFREPSRISTNSPLAQGCSRCVLHAARSSHCGLTCPCGLALSNHITYQP